MLDREFETQSVDPMALEPESGLAWYDARRKNLELVVSVQSPYEIVVVAAFATRLAGVLVAAMTETWRRTRSSANAVRRSYCPFAQRYSMATFWPST